KPRCGRPGQGETAQQRDAPADGDSPPTYPSPVLVLRHEPLLPTARTAFGAGGPTAAPGGPRQAAATPRGAGKPTQCVTDGQREPRGTQHPQLLLKSDVAARPKRARRSSCPPASAAFGTHSGGISPMVTRTAGAIDQKEQAMDSQADQPYGGGTEPADAEGQPY